MVPGVGHCAGGPGPNGFGEEGQPGASNDPEHDAVSALMTWVEHGQAPDTLPATVTNPDGRVVTRDRCHYSLLSHYTGHGDVHSATSYTCT